MSDLAEVKELTAFPMWWPYWEREFDHCAITLLNHAILMLEKGKATFICLSFDSYAGVYLGTDAYNVVRPLLEESIRDALTPAYTLGSWRVMDAPLSGRVGMSNKEYRIKWVRMMIKEMEARHERPAS